MPCNTDARSHSRAYRAEAAHGSVRVAIVIDADRAQPAVSRLRTDDAAREQYHGDDTDGFACFATCRP